jgi:NADPH:quinone reductase-like Zn-dependent oxidoreductase
MPRPHVLKLLSNNWSIGGLNLGHLWTELKRLRRIGLDVLRAWEEGAVRPEIAAEFSFEEAAEAHRMLGERRNLGKVLLVP